MIESIYRTPEEWKARFLTKHSWNIIVRMIT